MQINQWPSATKKAVKWARLHIWSCITNTVLQLLWHMQICSQATQLASCKSQNSNYKYNCLKGQRLTKLTSEPLELLTSLEAEAQWLSCWSAGSGPDSCEGLLTVHGLYGVGDVQFAAGRQRSQEGRRIIGALETLAGLQEALAIVHLQVHDGAAERWGNTTATSMVEIYFYGLTPVHLITRHQFSTLFFRNFRFTEETNWWKIWYLDKHL